MASLTVDGVPAGNTPRTVPVPPGRHVIVLDRPDCFERRREVEIRPGEMFTWDCELRVRDGDSEEVIESFAAEFGIELLHADVQSMRSGSSDAGLQVVYPRGNVRIADLTEGAIECNDTGMTVDGRAVLRRGEEVLLSVPITRDEFFLTIPIGPEVRAKVRPGDELTFGYVPRNGDETSVRVRVVDDGLSDRFAEIERRLAKQPVVLGDHLKAQALFDGEFYTGAYLAAKRIVDQAPGSTRGYYMMKKALERMGIFYGWKSDRLLDDIAGTSPEKQRSVIREED
jgi:hypothetical protein